MLSPGREQGCNQKIKYYEGGPGSGKSDVVANLWSSGDISSI